MCVLFFSLDFQRFLIWDDLNNDDGNIKYHLLRTYSRPVALYTLTLMQMALHTSYFAHKKLEAQRE